MSRVLLTGATGFVGRGTLEPLLAAGYEVHAVSRGKAPSWAPTQVIWHQADLLGGGCDALVRSVKPSHLLHMAWYAEPGAFWRSPLNLVWVKSSLDLLSAFMASGGERAVVAGTCAEYEWRSRTVCVENETPIRPATIYGASKHALHVMARALADEHNVSLAWGRIFFVFGPHEDERRLVSSVAKRVLEGERAPVTDGRQVRDFLYSEDLAAAFVALLGSEVQGAVNVASGTPLALRDLVVAVANVAGHPELLGLGERKAADGEPQVLTADTTRLNQEVGYRPEVSFTQRVDDTVAWWRAQLGAAD